jgi:hypothetical protein
MSGFFYTAFVSSFLKTAERRVNGLSLAMSPDRRRADVRGDGGDFP